jgi:hypothetical protein
MLMEGHMIEKVIISAIKMKWSEKKGGEMGATDEIISLATRMARGPGKRTDKLLVGSEFLPSFRANPLLLLPPCQGKVTTFDLREHSQGWTQNQVRPIDPSPRTPGPRRAS